MNVSPIKGEEIRIVTKRYMCLNFLPVWRTVLHVYYNRGVVVVKVLKIKETVILTYDMKGAYKNVAKGKTIVVRAYRPHFSSFGWFLGC